MSIFLRTNVFFLSLFLPSDIPHRVSRRRIFDCFAASVFCYRYVIFPHFLCPFVAYGHHHEHHREKDYLVFSVRTTVLVASLKRASSTTDWILSSLVVIIIITFPSESDFGDTQPKTRTRGGGFFFLEGQEKQSTSTTTQHPHTQG